jgi:hypothetical protein
VPCTSCAVKKGTSPTLTQRAATARGRRRPPGRKRFDDLNFAKSGLELDGVERDALEIVIAKGEYAELSEIAAVSAQMNIEAFDPHVAITLAE